MIRLSFLSGLLVIILLLTACPATPGPTPCAGESCPKPCETVANARTSSATFTVGTSTAPFQDCYARGTTHTVSFDLTPNSKANLNNQQAIIVVDVVKNSEPYPTVLGDLFDRGSFKVNPDIFSKVVPMSQIQTGIKADVTFTVLNSAPTGDLVFVISAFRGTTAEGSTANANLIGRIYHYFKVE
jgi:hypothetical protein